MAHPDDLIKIMVQVGTGPIEAIIAVRRADAIAAGDPNTTRTLARALRRAACEVEVGNVPVT